MIVAKRKPIHVKKKIVVVVLSSRSSSYWYGTSVHLQVARLNAEVQAQARELKALRASDERSAVSAPLYSI